MMDGIEIKPFEGQKEDIRMQQLDDQAGQAFEDILNMDARSAAEILGSPIVPELASGNFGDLNNGEQSPQFGKPLLDMFQKLEDGSLLKQAFGEKTFDLSDLRNSINQVGEDKENEGDDEQLLGGVRGPKQK